MAQVPIGRAAPATADFVELAVLDPSLRVELRYATADNFMHRAVYPLTARCYLRVPVAEKLVAVQRELGPLGLSLKLFDCYRPLSVQRVLWEVVHDERYVAHPDKGSRHNRGAAVDLTLVDKDGRELPMPTAYDAFDERAHRDYMKLPPEAIKNRQKLEAVMVKHGFVPLATEWWHFDAAEFKDYPLADVSFDALLPAAAPNALRQTPDVDAAIEDLSAEDLSVEQVKYLSAAVARLDLSRGNRRFSAKWKPMGASGSERQEGYAGNNAPRCEVAAWLLWHMLAERGPQQPDLVPPVVVRALHRDVKCERTCRGMPHLLSAEIPATFPDVNDHLVIGALSLWEEGTRMPQRLDGDLWNPLRFAKSAGYRLAAADLFLFLYLVGHSDPNYGANFLLGLPALDRLYSVDNGRALDGVPDRASAEDADWAPLYRLAPGRMVVPSLRRSTVTHLEKLMKDRPTVPLRVVAAVDMDSGRTVIEPSRDPRLSSLYVGEKWVPLHQRGPSFKRRSVETYTAKLAPEGPTWLLLGLSERGISDVWTRAERLLAHIRRGTQSLLDE